MSYKIIQVNAELNFMEVEYTEEDSTLTVGMPAAKEGFTRAQIIESYDPFPKSPEASLTSGELVIDSHASVLSLEVLTPRQPLPPEENPVAIPTEDPVAPA